MKEQLILLLKNIWTLFRQKTDRLLNKIFWRRNWKILTAAACGIIIVVLTLKLLISGQQEAGVQEAGIEVARLAQNIRNNYKTRPDFWGLSTAAVINQKIYPLSMTVDGRILKGYFGNRVEIGADEEGTAVMPSVRKFAITYKGLSKEQCIGLASNRFEQSFWLGVGGMKVSSSKGEQLFDWSNADFMLPAARDKVKKLCNSVNNVVFYFE